MYGEYGGVGRVGRSGWGSLSRWGGVREEAGGDQIGECDGREA